MQSTRSEYFRLQKTHINPFMSHRIRSAKCFWWFFIRIDESAVRRRLLIASLDDICYRFGRKIGGPIRHFMFGASSVRTAKYDSRSFSLSLSLSLTRSVSQHSFIVDKPFIIQFWSPSEFHDAFSFHNPHRKQKNKINKIHITKRPTERLY